MREVRWEKCRDQRVRAIYEHDTARLEGVRDRGDGDKTSFPLQDQTSSSSPGLTSNLYTFSSTCPVLASGYDQMGRWQRPRR